MVCPGGEGAMVGWLRRMRRGPGSLRRVIVAMAAVILAAGALGFLVWSLTTQNPAWLAWLASTATVWGFVLSAWGMLSTAMLT